MHIQRHPKEPTIRRIDLLRARLRALKDPLRIARRRIDLVPPAQPHEAAPSDVFQVVEVGGQEEDGQDEDEDAVQGAEMVSMRGTLWRLRGMVPGRRNSGR